MHKAVPGRGYLGIFNRSHYEEVLIVRVHGLAPPAEIEQRYEHVCRSDIGVACGGCRLHRGRQCGMRLGGGVETVHSCTFLR